jgi:hypothetical protein
MRLIGPGTTFVKYYFSSPKNTITKPNKISFALIDKALYIILNLIPSMPREDVTQIRRAASNSSVVNGSASHKNLSEAKYGNENSLGAIWDANAVNQALRYAIEGSKIF